MDETQGYTYSRHIGDGEGSIRICGPEGNCVITFHFWDEPDSAERYDAMQSAQVICTHLNRWHLGRYDSEKLHDWRVSLNGDLWPAADLEVVAGERTGSVPLVRLSTEPCDVGCLLAVLELPDGYDITYQGKSVIPTHDEAMAAVRSRLARAESGN